MIYSKRSGLPCEIVRLAVLGDVRKFEHRKADASDKRAVAQGSYFICNWADGSGGEFLASVWLLSADGGLAEIMGSYAKAV
jgi:hypothetical protein